MKYAKEHLTEISFPLGGIGTGCIGLAGNGSLVDWELFNRPNKGSINGHTHIAVKATKKDGTTYAKVLNGDYLKPLTGQYGQIYGRGPAPETMCGFPHFENCTFNGEFPVASIDFSDKNFPAEIRLTAFNPFIPLDSKNSSIPAAFFELEVTNTSDEDIDFHTAFSLASPYIYSVNKDKSTDKYAMVKIENIEVEKSDVDYGDLTIACDDANACVQTYWYRSEWQDNITMFWNEFCSKEGLSKRTYPDDKVKLDKKDTCSIMSGLSLLKDETKKVRFIISWNIPNNYNYWSPLKDENGNDVTWKNYYATIFEDSVSSAIYSLDNYDSLYKRTLKFKNALHTQTLDSAVIDAASSTLSVLKSPTVLRLEDGSFYGWEGCHEKFGSCEGICQHVWNYAYALCFLFPDLERSIRDLEAKYSTYDSGEMDFRLKLPLGRDKVKFRACVDGQMGAIIKTYREWKISGNDEWLRSHWPTLKKILEFAWSDENKDEWDRDKDGVLEGRQHHTLDMELFGPSSWLEGFYLAALKAASEMAAHLGHDDEAKEYMILYEKGYAWTKENLFNGKYFFHKIDVTDKSITDHFNCSEPYLEVNSTWVIERCYWNKETKEIKYQIGDGCEIDQMCAQWHANLLGLGDIFDKEQVKIALANMYKNNFKTSMRDAFNPWRIFCINDESGAIICDYPEGAKKPALPIPYCEETMHGFEYQFAGHLISEGFVEEGLSVVRSVRNRYDGKKRNPYNEIECGNNYARSMAAFALLPIFSGFEFDMPHKTIGFSPLTDGDFKGFWSLDSGWGIFEQTASSSLVIIEEGSLCISKLILKNAKDIKDVKIDGKSIFYSVENNKITFNEATIKNKIEVIH